MRKPTAKKPSIKTLKRKADEVFSKYIRLRDAHPDGTVECYTCGRRGYWQKDGIQCGHGISGRGNFVRYLAEICRPQCYSCNVGKMGFYEVFIPKLQKEITPELYDQFVIESRKALKRTRQDYEDIILYYDMRVKELTDALQGHP